MSVVNVKVKNIRQEGYDNLREWMANPNHVYVGRGRVVFIDGKGPSFPPQDSIFCNRFKVGKDGTREEVIAKFRKDLEEKLGKDPALVQELMALKGKTLGCWCKPDGCHADVLLELIEVYKSKIE